MRASKKGREMVIRYVNNRVLGLNKTASARNAGYKFPNSRVSNIEKTNNFREITSQILADNSSNAILVIESINSSLKSKEFTELPIQTKVKILVDIANVQKSLSPDLRIKETIDDKGKVTRTMWNTASPMQAQAITSEQKPLQTKDETNVAEYILYDTDTPQDIDTVNPTPTAQT